MKHNNILIIMKKEFARFFGDRRMLFTSMLMPGLLMYVIYSFMGGAFANIGHDGDMDIQYTYVYTNDLPASMTALDGPNGLDIQPVAPEALESVKEDIQNGVKGLLLVFPDNAAPSDTPSRVEIYYNSSAPSSDSLYQTALALLNKYQSFDLAGPAEDPTSAIFASMLPMLLMIFFFSSCIALAPESIAGEKERGTIATLLVTPVRSWQLAAGKIFSLALMALLCGLFSAAGAILGLRSMAQSAGGTFSVNLDDPKAYLLLLLVVLSTILLSIALISLVSAYSKSVKEANTTALPLLFLSLMASLLPMFGGTGGDAWYYYAIPLYNGARCMGDLFGQNYSVVNALTTVVSNVVFATAGGFALAKMFGNEKIIMSK